MLVRLVPKLHFGTQLFMKLYFITSKFGILHTGAMLRGREIQFRGQVRSKIQFLSLPTNLGNTFCEGESLHFCIQNPNGIP